MANAKIIIKTEEGQTVEAFAPVVVSASRSTDIPAFYADWFFERLRRNYSIWTNPFNGVPSYVSYLNTRFIVFWSKNPRPLLPHLDYLEQRGIGCYIQFTLNDYEDDGLEKGVPPIEQRIETFRLLVEKLGKGRVIWRFDPMILTDRIDIDSLLRKVEYIGNQLKDHAEKLVFSFADIESYRKVKMNLDKSGVNYREWDEASMEEFSRRLSVMNKELGWGLTLATCGEKIDLGQYGIEHNRCIDDDLMIRFGYKDKALMDFLKVDIEEMPHMEPGLFEEFNDSVSIPANAILFDDRCYAVKRHNNRDNGQRKYCGCVISKDIGQYNTCPHLCEYCYANTSKEAAIANWQRHCQSPHSPRIVGQ